MSSQERFGYEWNKYSDLDQRYESQFRNWIHPLTEVDFKDREVLDAGCGMGRNSYWPLQWGAKEVTAFDFDKRSVGAASQTLMSFDNTRLLYRSIYDIDWEDRFDVAFSIGVIHHLKDPGKAIENLYRSLKPGGKLLIWVYSYEGNEWIVKYVDPVRKNITSKLPLGVVSFLSYFCSIPLWLYIKAGRGLTPYLQQLKTFKFWHVHSIVFDQLIPDVANYWKKEEIQKLVEGMDVQYLDSPPNKCGWTIIIKK